MLRNEFAWLTGVSNDYVRQAAETKLYGRLGLLMGPGTYGGPGSKANYCPHIESYHDWGLDNGCFSNCGEFDEDAWLSRLDWIVNEIPDAHDKCLFAVAPDVFDPVAQRGDPIATFERSLSVLPKIRSIGVPAAIVLQDGVEDFPLDSIPWSEFDVAFVGGGDRFKLGYPHGWESGDRSLTFDRLNESTLRFMRLLHRVECEGIPLHVGRVNTKIRFIYSFLAGAASMDGTMFAFSGEQGLARIERWFASLNKKVDLPSQSSFSFAA